MSNYTNYNANGVPPNIDGSLKLSSLHVSTQAPEHANQPENKEAWTAYHHGVVHIKNSASSPWSCTYLGTCHHTEVKRARFNKSWHQCACTMSCKHYDMWWWSSVCVPANIMSSLQGVIKRSYLCLHKTILSLSISAFKYGPNALTHLETHVAQLRVCQINILHTLQQRLQQIVI